MAGLTRSLKHFVHHEGGAKQNYGIINFQMDVLIGSFFTEKPRKENVLVSDKQTRKKSDAPIGIDIHRIGRIFASKKSALVSAAVRFVAVMICLALWYETQSMIASAGKIELDRADSYIFDRLHRWMNPYHDYLLKHPDIADLLIFASSLSIDLVGIFMLVASIFGPTVRPFFGIIFVCMLRQLCQMLVTLPSPENMIWRDPEFLPSIFVTYDTENDFFFSGHTAFAVIASTEFVRMIPAKHLSWKIIACLLGWMFVAFQAGTVLLLKSHWTLDVLCGAIAGRYACLVSRRYCHYVDDNLP